MQSIDFNSFDHNFCESSIYSEGQHPEYMNSLSSLFISFIGINALLKSNINLLLAFLYSSLIVNGVTSCFYHYYNNIGWGLMDRMSMILIAQSSTNLFINTLNYIIVLQRLKLVNIKVFFIKMVNILSIIYFTILFSIAGLHNEKLFNIMFAIFLFSIVGFMYIINLNYIRLGLPYEVLLLGWKGIIYITTSGVFWIVTENLCHDIFYIKYLFGHVWWHIFVSYGGYLVSLIPWYMYMDRILLISKYNIVITYDIFNIPYLKFTSYHGIDELV
jgi:hypothetical protein